MNLNNNQKQLKKLGAFLLVASGIFSFGWLYWLAPLDRIESSDWIANHSQKAWWEESQKVAKRIGVTHSVGIEIGLYGDKSWAAWIINRIKPGDDIDSCSAGHIGHALADISNQQLPAETEIWLAWWQTNQNKTQIEWIREGFAQRGVVLENPLTTNNIIALLKLANPATNSPIHTNGAAKSVRMNAFRWLRDSGVNYQSVFEIWNRDVNNIPSEDRKQIVEALLSYAVWYQDNYFAPGKLPLKENMSGRSPSEYEPFTRTIRWVLVIIIPLIAILGLFLIFKSSSIRC